MASRRNLSLFALLFVGFLGALAGQVAGQADPDHAKSQFDAHSFAVFRSNYEALRMQSTSMRADHFHRLVDASEDAEFTQGMAATLAEFCRTVLRSEDSSEVKSEARLALNSLEKRFEPHAARAEAVEEAASSPSPHRGLATATHP